MTISLSRFAMAVVTALVVALGSGCRPTLAAESSAPPGRSARLDEVNHWFWGLRSYRLELSQGVALAVSCMRGGPCEKLVATSDNATIAEVRPASLAALRPAGLAGNQQPAAAVVIVGKAPGTTKVRVRSKDGGRDIAVTVVAPSERHTSSSRTNTTGPDDTAAHAPSSATVDVMGPRRSSL